MENSANSFVQAQVLAPKYVHRITLDLFKISYDDALYLYETTKTFTQTKCEQSQNASDILQMNSIRYGAEITIYLMTRSNT